MKRQDCRKNRFEMDGCSTRNIKDFAEHYSAGDGQGRAVLKKLNH